MPRDLKDFSGDSLIIGGACSDNAAVLLHPVRTPENCYTVDIDHNPDAIADITNIDQCAFIPNQRFSFILFEHITYLGEEGSRTAFETARRILKDDGTLVYIGGGDDIPEFLKKAGFGAVYKKEYYPFMAKKPCIAILASKETRPSKDESISISSSPQAQYYINYYRFFSDKPFVDIISLQSEILAENKVEHVNNNQSLNQSNMAEAQPLDEKQRGVRILQVGMVVAYLQAKYLCNPTNCQASEIRRLISDLQGGNCKSQTLTRDKETVGITVQFLEQMLKMAATGTLSDKDIHSKLHKELSILKEQPEHVQGQGFQPHINRLQGFLSQKFKAWDDAYGTQFSTILTHQVPQSLLDNPTAGQSTPLLDTKLNKQQAPRLPWPDPTTTERTPLDTKLVLSEEQATRGGDLVYVMQILMDSYLGESTQYQSLQNIINEVQKNGLGVHSASPDHKAIAVKFLVKLQPIERQKGLAQVKADCKQISSDFQEVGIPLLNKGAPNKRARNAQGAFSVLKKWFEAWDRSYDTQFKELAEWILKLGHYHPSYSKASPEENQGRQSEFKKLQPSSLQPVREGALVVYQSRPVTGTPPPNLGADLPAEGPALGNSTPRCSFWHKLAVGGGIGGLLLEGYDWGLNNGEISKAAWNLVSTEALVFDSSLVVMALIAFCVERYRSGTKVTHPSPPESTMASPNIS